MLNRMSIKENIENVGMVRTSPVDDVHPGVDFDTGFSRHHDERGDFNVERDRDTIEGAAPPITLPALRQRSVRDAGKEWLKRFYSDLTTMTQWKSLTWYDMTFMISLWTLTSVAAIVTFSFIASGNYLGGFILALSAIMACWVSLSNE